MTLTQVSTWFANARRRLKKENKWSPDGSCDDGSENGESVSDQSEGVRSVQNRIPSSQPGQDESGYSSSDRSDRDAQSPPVQIPSQPLVGYPVHPALLPVIPTMPTTTLSPEKTSPVPIPRFLPKLSPTGSTAKSARKARSLWSIADITGSEVTETEIEDEVDVTA